MKPKWKLDNNILLHLLLEQSNLTKGQWSKMCYNKLRLNDATHIARETLPRPTETQPDRHQNSNIWTTPTHNIRATDYGRITAVEPKRQPRPQRPTITVKKAKHYEKT